LSKPRTTSAQTRGRQQLRIIAGTARRRIVTFPEAEGLRPTPDRVRETLFNWLGQELYGLRCLDLFAGAGGLGFEAASRGAAEVVMVERSRPVFTSLLANQRALGLTAVRLVLADALTWLAQARASGERFDVVFLDPPFASTLLNGALASVGDLLQPRGRVYLESAAWPALDAGWQVLRQAQAGAVHYGLIARAEVPVAWPCAQ
jgi:16S rRNA (guanine966-N2)-methyltransferase